MQWLASGKDSTADGSLPESLLPQMSNLSQSVKRKMIFWRLDPLWSPGCPNPRVESNDVKHIFIFVLFNKHSCVLSKNFVTYSTATQIYISTTCKTAMTTSGKISKNIQFQNTHAGFTIFSVHSQHLKSSSSAFRPALSNLWLLPVIIIIIIITIIVSLKTRSGRCCCLSSYGAVRVGGEEIMKVMDGWLISRRRVKVPITLTQLYYISKI